MLNMNIYMCFSTFVIERQLGHRAQTLATSGLSALVRANLCCPCSNEIY